MPDNLIPLGEFVEKNKQRRRDAATVPSKASGLLSEVLQRVFAMAEKGTLSTADLQEIINSCGYRLSYNEVLMRFENYGEAMTDGVHREIFSEMRQLGDLAGEHKLVAKTLQQRAVVEDAIIAAHYSNTVNPIRDYLALVERKRTLDGSSAFEYLSGCFKDKRGHFPLFMRKFLLGCVARTFDGFQNYTLVLQGGQGIGKSTFCKWLCDGLGLEYFQEGVILPAEKDHKLRLATKFIWAVDEFGETLQKTSSNALKAFLTQDTVNERPPYARNAIIARRHCNVIATTNDENFLRDITGNRRYLVLNVDSIDHSYSRHLSPNELWAEVMEWYRRGEMPQLDAYEKAAQKVTNSESEEESVLEIFLTETFAKSSDAASLPAMQVYSRVFTRFEAHGLLREEDALMKRTKAIITQKWGVRASSSNGVRYFRGLGLK